MKPSIAIVSISLMLCGTAALAVPTYTIVSLGLTEDLYYVSLGLELNDSGQATGFTSHSNGGPAQSTSAWLYDGVTTRKIGLTGGVYTREDGTEFSFPVSLNSGGHVSGYSWRFDSRRGNGFLDSSAWLYDGVITKHIGLHDSEHTRDDGFTSSYTSGGLNNIGQVSGGSSRYNGGRIDLGDSAWLFDGTTTRTIGLIGAEHTRNDGYKNSFTDGWLNETGQEIGYSSRYNGGSADLGRSAWLFDGATTRNIGLVGSEYTRDDGYRSSNASRLNEVGQVIGDSTRFNGGSADLGRSAWLYDGTNTLNIGLTDSAHTRIDGFQYSLASRLNNAGAVAGVSDRYNGGSVNLGRSAWLYDGTTTFEIGLTDAEHSRNDGYRSSYVWGLNEAGQVIGESARYLGGSNYLGSSAWFFDGATTRQIGLTDAAHTSSDGYQDSEAYYLNEAGQVVGRSKRYLADNTEGGQDAWFYDAALDQTFVLQLSARSDGYAYSGINYLGDDGLVLGSYILFDDLDNELGGRAFSFTVADGLHDLGSLVEGGLSANGWDSLLSASSANSRGQILGDAFNSPEGNYSAFLLTPIVPEPSSLVIVLHGILFLYCRNTLGRYRTGCR